LELTSDRNQHAFSDWKKMQAIHVDGAFLTTKAALKHMYKDDRGAGAGYTVWCGTDSVAELVSTLSRLCMCALCTSSVRLANSFTAETASRASASAKKAAA
jgi:NAD(P)-dependent dehydrogenase (short-subunit alcohol dehydrogenase family)